MASTALLSVSDKEGLIPFAKSLIEVYDFKILSSGGTAKLLEEAGLTVTKVSDFTGFPEILDGRVKTLHPYIHGGILAKRNNPTHTKEMEQHGIENIDLVVVNLYPFKETVKEPNVNWDQAIENIDIGGPAMIRSAAKNHAHVSILTKSNQYSEFLEILNKNKGNIPLQYKQKLCLEAFEHTASYDIAISKWFGLKLKSKSTTLVEEIPLRQTLRYGENPHQAAKWYSHEGQGWGGAVQLQGKELSTNNLLDLEAALSTVSEFGYGKDGSNPALQSAAVVIKHTNPCGVAIGETIEQALNKALDADRISSFGGIIAVNKTLNEASAIHIKSQFIECVVAPDFEDEALKLLKEKQNLRLLKITPKQIEKASIFQIRSISGGLLVQELDKHNIDTMEWNVPTKQQPTLQLEEDLAFAWRIVRHVRSNAIVIAKCGQSLGIGAGQMNRVGSAEIAINSAREKSNGAVLASDGFFPFDDTVRLAAKHGIKAIIQPGGSLRDKDSIAACDELNISMTFTGKRHFLH